VTCDSHSFDTLDTLPRILLPFLRLDPFPFVIHITSIHTLVACISLECRTGTDPVDQLLGLLGLLGGVSSKDTRWATPRPEWSRVQIPVGTPRNVTDSVSPPLADTGSDIGQAS
jgi:hypothetical protein